MGDDYTLLDAALRVPLPDLLTGRHGIIGYYRPVSRELYYWFWGRAFGPNPFGYHAVNALTYAGALVMFLLFLRRWLGERVAMLATLAYVLFPPGGTLLSWISCAQDLIALFWCTAALLLHQSGRRVLTGIAVALAALSKETAMVVPFVLAAHDWAALPARGAGADRAPFSWSRLIGPFAGLAVALALSIAARTTWPTGTAISIWSPQQMIGAWRLPLDFLRTLVPPGTLEGIVVAWRQTPVLLVSVALLAVAAVPAGRWMGKDARRAVLFGLAVMLIGILPVAVITERWRGYFFSIAALGSSVVLAILLARLGPWTARVAAAVLAIVNFGANSAYRPIEAQRGSARHPHANFAFFKENSELSDRLLRKLEPWCPAIRSLPRTFVAGSERDMLVETMTGPALRVTCRDTTVRVRFLDEFTPADARSDFGVLRFDQQALDFSWERAGARARAQLGEGFLLQGRYPLAAETFEAAARERPGDAELVYPLAVSLAAAGRTSEARERWKAAGRAVSAATLAQRLTGGAGGNAADPVTERLAAEVLADPTAAAPHAALGRRVLELGATRQGALELSIASGIGGKSEDLVTLGEAYEALGAPDEARERYRRALAGEITPALHERARRRLEAIESAMSRQKTGRP